MKHASRLSLFAGFTMGLAAFWFGPAALALGESGLILWAVVAQIGGPIAAAILCFLAARRSAGGDVGAWTLFGAGSVLYLFGNLFYLFHGLAGTELGFPTVPEAAFFIMAAFFASGISRYGQLAQRTGQVQFYNFLLTYGAVTFGCLFALDAAIQASVLGDFATIVAFSYPALWFSVGAFGVISLVLYDLREKTFPFALLILAILAEAAADFYYALALMDGSYQLGGLTQLLWVASAGLICWAAVEQIALTRRPQTNFEFAPSGRGMVQATVPAAALAMIFLTGSISGAFGTGLYQVFSGLVAVSLAVAVALREWSIINTERALTEVAETSRARLADSKRRLTSVLQSTSDSVIVLDRAWRIEFYNDEALKLVEELHDVGRGGSFWDLFRPSERVSLEGPYRRSVETQEPLVSEIFSESRGIWLEIRAYPAEDGLSIFFRDISEQRRVREELEHQAQHDSLTGLSNRLLFRNRLRAATQSGAAALLLLDLDNFKEINDTLGHSIGDALLVGIANRLRSCVRQSDTVSRLGGDEFAILLAGRPERGDAEQLAQRILAESTSPYFLDDRSIIVSVSIGVVHSEVTEGPDELFRKADIALYAAKAEPVGAYHVFEPTMAQRLEERRALRIDLAAALKNNEFEIYYQPVVDLKSGHVACFEALLRWRHPTRGMVPPDAFIAAAEESGLIVPIGDWVLGAACAEAMNWPETISVAVNLSTRQFGAGDLPGAISRSLLSSGLASGRLELEITESVLLHDSATNLETLEEIRSMGVRVSLDDFGTGYSSLSYLQKFQFSKVKIDRSFVEGLPDRDESRAIVSAIIGLGRSLGIRVTAEGVETEAQYDWVRSGCHEAQGYLLSRPVPAAEIPLLLERLNFRRLGLRARSELRRKPHSSRTAHASKRPVDRRKID